MHHQVILIGRRMNTALVGVKETHPDVVHLLYTSVVSDRYQAFLKMLDPGVEIHTYEIEPYDAFAQYNLCQQIHSSLRPGDTLEYNLTEGTKVVAFSALAAAKDFGDSAVYYSQEGDKIMLYIDANGEPTSKKEAIRSRISNEEFVQLYGSNLIAYNDSSDLMPVDVATANDVKIFHEQFQKAFQRIIKQFRSEFGARIDRLPAEYAVEREKGMYVTIGGGAMKIVDRGKTIFENNNPNTTRLFFTGRWWEILVSDVVTRWDRQRHANPADSQVWRNVEFRGVSASKTKNELDILVNDRRRLILIECKSGYIAQENIYKIDSTRDTYGGRDSKGILVSYYPLDPELVQKCRDLHVYWFAPEKDSEKSGYLKKLPQWLDKVVKDIEA